MSSPVPTRPWTPEEFLAWERQQPERYEWDGANIVSMTGGRRRHARVIRNIRNALENLLPDGCEIYTEGFKLLAGEAVRYPDVLLLCTPEHTVDLEADIVNDATLVVEVLSPSTARTDRVTKVEDYAKVPSMLAYLIVDPGQHSLTLYRREEGQLVPVPAAEVAGETVVLFESMVLEVDAIYAGVL